MAWKEDMMIELENLQECIERRKCEIETGVDKLEEGKKARDVKKREFLLKEMKQVLAKLNEVDKNIVKDLKGEAFDFLRGMRKINEEIAAFKDSLEEAPESNRSWRTEVNALKGKVENLEMEDFVASLDISVGIQPGSMITAFEKVSDAIYLETPVLDSKGLYLAFPEQLPTFEEANFNVNYIEIRIYSLGEDASFKFTSLLLQKTIVTMTGHVPDVGTKVLEEGSVGSMMEKKKAELSKDGKYVSVKLRRPSKIVCKISVHLLGSNVVNSPITHTFLNGEATTDPAKGNMTLGNESIGIFDMTGLDQSDINSLDITNRQQKRFFAPGKQHLLSNPTLQPSPAYHPLRRAAQVPSVAPEKLNDTTPFNPNPTYASTMRGTVTASNLAGALSKMSEEAVSTKEGGSTPENSKMDESELSILAPSRNSGISIDDMQRSLSGSESGAGDRSVYQPDKSVSFAPQTQVVEVLSTPQVSASSGGPRFLVAEGQTKPGDGKKGHVRRLNKDKEGRSDGIWDLTEVDEEMTEEYNASNAVTPSLVPSSNQSDISPIGESYYEDPHLMLNASKAPSPQKSWSKEDSIWDAVDMEEEMVEEFNSCNAVTLPLLPRDAALNEESCLDSFYNDPHLMLNASKAPSPQSAWSKEDSIWDWGWEQDSFKNPPREDINQTIWENETPGPVSKFDFREPLEVVDVYESQQIGSSRRGTKCLISPHSIAFVPQRNLFLVSEPHQDRVGVYHEETFKFHTWMDYPKQFAKTRQNYENPTSILSLTNEFLALIERDRLHIFDSHGLSVQSFGGEFHGLSEGPNGEIFTLGRNSLGQHSVKILVKTSSNYKSGGQIPLSVIQEFENWETLSKARFLMYSNERIYITDEGLHKLYIVNLIGGKQMVTGYLGTKSGQFKRPTGLMVDDLGNVLVGDGDNNRLLVYTSEGKFLKVVTQQEDWRYSSPCDLVRQGNSVLAVFRGEGMWDKGAIVKYKVSGDSGLNTPESGSEIEV